MCKVYTGYHGTSKIEHGLCACTFDNPIAKGRGLSLRTGAQTILCLNIVGISDDLRRAQKLCTCLMKTGCKGTYKTN